MPVVRLAVRPGQGTPEGLRTNVHRSGKAWLLGNGGQVDMQAAPCARPVPARQHLQTQAGTALHELHAGGGFSGAQGTGRASHSRSMQACT